MQTQSITDEAKDIARYIAIGAFDSDLDRIANAIGQRRRQLEMQTAAVLQPGDGAEVVRAWDRRGRPVTQVGDVVTVERVGRTGKVTVQLDSGVRWTIPASWVRPC